MTPPPFVRKHTGYFGVLPVNHAKRYNQAKCYNTGAVQDCMQYMQYNNALT